MTPTVKIRLIRRKQKTDRETGRPAVNQNGYPIWDETSREWDETFQAWDEPFREVWAEEKGPTRSEFYAAQQAGVSVSATFTMYQRLYRGEQIVECRGERYRVIRAYPKDHTEMILVCSSEKEDQHGALCL